MTCHCSFGTVILSYILLYCVCRRYVLEDKLTLSTKKFVLTFSPPTQSDFTCGRHFLNAQTNLEDLYDVVCRYGGLSDNLTQQNILRAED